MRDKGYSTRARDEKGRDSSDKHDKRYGSAHYMAHEGYLIGKAAQIAREQLHAEKYTGMAKQLVKNGAWQVPPAERPKGWERLNVAEQNA
jgi:hypothetical protein